MDSRERYFDPIETMRMALDGNQAGMWTAMPGLIQSFDPLALTATVKVSIKSKLSQPDGSVVSVALPILQDCPVVFPSGGGYTLTFPVAHGDECLVIFASRCIDAWWQLGGVQEQAEFRMHDLSDGFVFVGPRSQPRTLPSLSTDATQLRSDAGTTFIELKNGLVTIHSDDVKVNCATAEINATTSVDVNTPQATFEGNVTVKGLLSYLAGLAGIGGSVGSNITGDIIQSGGVLSSNGTALHTHTHPFTDSHGDTGNTGAPN